MRGRLFNISQTFLLAYLQVSIIRTEFSSLDNLRSVWTPDSRDSGHTYSPPALPQETWYVWPEGPSSSWELTPFEHFPVFGGSCIHETPIAALLEAALPLGMWPPCVHSSMPILTHPQCFASSTFQSCHQKGGLSAVVIHQSQSQGTDGSRHHFEVPVPSQKAGWGCGPTGTL